MSKLSRPFASLYVQVLIAILIGVLIGHFAPQVGVALKPLGDGFIRLIKMIIAPVIFCTVVLGIAGMEDLKSVGRTGLYALGYFEVVTTFALILGLIVVNVLAPGAGMHVNPATLDTHGVTQYAQRAEHQGVAEFLLNIIPTTMFDAFAKGEILQVLLIAILFGFALHAVGARALPVRQFIESFNRLLFRIVGMIMYLAPIGALGAMAFTIGSQGIVALAPLAKLMLCFYLTCVIFVVFVLGAIARLHGLRILRLVRFFKDELLIVLGTSSSETVLPRMMVKLEALGVRRSVVGLVVPAGYSFNLDGTCIYLTMAAVFLAQATDTPMTLLQQVTLLVVLLLTSKGAAGVTGSGFIVLAGTLAAVNGPPIAALALILGVDRFMSEARALTNLVGNALATLVVARWTGALDMSVLQQRLAASSPALETEKDLSMNVVDPATLSVRTGSGYPEPFRSRVTPREKRAVGDALGLTRIGVNLTTLLPGKESSMRHWHTHEDELVMVLQGQVVLRSEAGEQMLVAGMFAGFPAGSPDGHQLINRSNEPAVYLEISNRDPGNDVCTYPDVDLMFRAAAQGGNQYTRKDGTPY